MTRTTTTARPTTPEEVLRRARGVDAPIAPAAPALPLTPEEVLRIARAATSRVRQAGKAAPTAAPATRRPSRPAPAQPAAKRTTRPAAAPVAGETFAARMARLVRPGAVVEYTSRFSGRAERLFVTRVADADGRVDAHGVQLDERDQPVRRWSFRVTPDTAVEARTAPRGLNALVNAHLQGA